MAIGTARRILLLGTIFVCGLNHQMGMAAEVQSRKIPVAGNRVHVNLSCHPSKDVQSSNTIERIVLQKIEPAFGRLVIASVVPRGRLSISEALLGKFTGSGKAASPGNSYIELSLLHPRLEDDGKYECLVYYKDGTGLHRDSGRAYVDMKEFPPSQTECEAKWTKNFEDDTCSFVYRSPLKTWTEARSFCQQHGGDLMRIGDKNKQTFFETWHRIKTNPHWIGLRRTMSMAKTFTWLNDTSPTKFTAWNRGEPNNYNGNEDCVSTWKFSTLWNDVNCYNKFPFFCEKPARPVVLKEIHEKMSRLEQRVAQMEVNINERVKSQSQSISNRITHFTESVSSSVDMLFQKGVKKWAKRSAMDAKIKDEIEIFEQTLKDQKADLQRKISAGNHDVTKKQSLKQSELKSKMKFKIGQIDAGIQNYAKNDSLNRVLELTDNLRIQIQNQMKNMKSVENKVTVISSDLDDVTDSFVQMVLTSQSNDGANGKLKANVAEKIKDLEEQIQNKTGRFNYLQEKANISQMTDQVSRLAKSVDELTHRDSKSVAFSTTLSTELSIQFPRGDAVIFDDVIVNQGQGYNKTIGQFKAPVSGLYVFHLVITSLVDDEWLDFDLMVNENLEARLTSREKDHEAQTSVSHVSQLRAGDTVYVTIKYSASDENKLFNHKLSFFTGYLLQARY